MVRWKAERTRFVFGMSIVIILLFGCGQLNQQNEIEKETTSINLDGVILITAEIMINKKTIVLI